jgi:hypothetical protein
MASQERTFFNSFMMPGSREEALGVEAIRELMVWAILFSEEDIIAIETFSTLYKDNDGDDLWVK